MNRVHPALLALIRAYFAPGTRVRLVRPYDPGSPLLPGDTGTVFRVDETGMVYVVWDHESGSVAVPYIDAIERLDGATWH
mgnify:CR=1 FL=1